MTAQHETLSRRKALGILGLATLVAYAAPTGVSLSSAEAQPRRRTDRRRTDRRRRRTDRRRFFFRERTRRRTDRRRRRTDRRRYW